MDNFKCPDCKSNIVKSYGSEVKLRAKLIKWNKDGMFAICKSCGCEVPITQSILKSVSSKFTFEI